MKLDPIYPVVLAWSNATGLKADSKEIYLKLNDIDQSFIDQLIFRFSKLQDTIGEKIFPSILILTKEDVKKKNFYRYIK